jgi:hypothetical protein
MISVVASDDTLDKAYHWLCKARLKYSPNSDVWDLRFHWKREKFIIQQQLLTGRYTLSSMIRLEIDGEVKTFWGARDALVLKAIALVLGDEVTPHLSERCWHLRGRGLKAAVRTTQESIPEYKFVFRSDVDSYYASIDHDTLLDLCSEFVTDPIVLNLIVQSMKRTETMGGLFWEFNVGIPMGSPLSPILSAVALLPLDRALTRAGCFYARYVDDWIVLTKTRAQLRKMVRITNLVLAKLKQTKHPDKTFIGRIAKGFDFLGYHFNGLALRPAKITIQRAFDKILQLYERKASPNQERLAGYLRRWNIWVRAGLFLSHDCCRGGCLTGGSLPPLLGCYYPLMRGMGSAAQLYMQLIYRLNPSLPNIS